MVVGSVVDPEEEEEGEGSRLEVAVRPEAGVDSEEDRPEAGSVAEEVAVDAVLLAAVAEAGTKGCTRHFARARGSRLRALHLDSLLLPSSSRIAAA